MLKNSLAAAVFILVIALMSAGQTSGSEIFIGYSNLQGEGLPNRNEPAWIFDTDFFRDRTTLHGMEAAVSGFGSGLLGFSGDVSINRRGTSEVFTGGESSRHTDIYYFLAGPALKWNRGGISRIEPFMRVLGGAAHTRFNASTAVDTSGGTATSSFRIGSTDLAAGVGGGLDVRAGDRTRIRLFQFDYLPVFLGDHTISALGGSGVIEPSTLDGQRQDNFRFSFGIVF